tara:strand:- start:786 stop:1097 length:312 start_codon:yes stop_codon:yes gene_type:complete
MELTIDEIDFLVDIECRSFLHEQKNRFEAIDIYNNLEKSNDEKCTMLFFKDKLSAVLSYKNLINAPNISMLWDMEQQSYCIIILTEWLTKFRNESKKLDIGSL